MQKKQSSSFARSRIRLAALILIGPLMLLAGCGHTIVHNKNDSCKKIPLPEKVNSRAVAQVLVEQWTEVDNCNDRIKAAGN